MTRVEKVLCELPQAGCSICNCNTGPYWSPGQPGTLQVEVMAEPQEDLRYMIIYLFFIKNPPRIVYKVGFVIWRVKKVILRVLGKKRVGTRVMHAE